MKKCEYSSFNRAIDLILVRKGFTMHDDNMKEIEKKIVKRIEETKRRVREIKRITNPLDFF